MDLGQAGKARQTMTTDPEDQALRRHLASLDALVEAYDALDDGAEIPEGELEELTRRAGRDVDAFLDVADPGWRDRPPRTAEEDRKFAAQLFANAAAKERPEAEVLARAAFWLEKVHEMYPEEDSNEPESEPDE